MKRLLWLCCVGLLLASCSKIKNTTNAEQEDHTRCLCPPIIVLQPFEGMPQKDVLQVKKELEKHLLEWFDLFEYEIRPPKKLTADLMNKQKTRYRAATMIALLNKEANDHNIFIGLTNKDISARKGNHEDWGVAGLSIHPGYACVVSSYRVRNKKDLWKVVAHEFIHQYFNRPHCPQNDPHCIMQDCGGNTNFSMKDKPCDICLGEYKNH